MFGGRVSRWMGEASHSGVIASHGKAMVIIWMIMLERRRGTESVQQDIQGSPDPNIECTTYETLGMKDSLLHFIDVIQNELEKFVIPDPGSEVARNTSVLAAKQLRRLLVEEIEMPPLRRAALASYGELLPALRQAIGPEVCDRLAQVLAGADIAKFQLGWPKEDTVRHIDHWAVFLAESCAFFGIEFMA